LEGELDFSEVPRSPSFSPMPLLSQDDLSMRVLSLEVSTSELTKRVSKLEGRTLEDRLVQLEAKWSGHVESDLQALVARVLALESNSGSSKPKPRAQRFSAAVQVSQGRPRSRFA
jgi:hypothetical protein